MKDFFQLRESMGAAVGGAMAMKRFLDKNKSDREKQRDRRSSSSDSSSDTSSSTSNNSRPRSVTPQEWGQKNHDSHQSKAGEHDRKAAQHQKKTGFIDKLSGNKHKAAAEAHKAAADSHREISKKYLDKKNYNSKKGRDALNKASLGVHSKARDAFNVSRKAEK
jgi:hypothetical protein